MTTAATLFGKSSDRGSASLTVLDASPVGIVVFQDDETIAYVNPQAETLFSKKLPAAGRLKCGDFIQCAHRHTAPRGCGTTADCPNCPLLAAMRSALSPSGNASEGEALVQREKNLEPIWIRYKFSRIRYNGFTGAVMAADDISVQKKARTREAYIKQVLLAIRNVNQLIVQESDAQNLIDKACSNLTETLGYFSAWIALLQEDGKTVGATGSSGLQGAFAKMQAQLARGEFPGCVRQALAQDSLVVVTDPAAACRGCPLERQYGGYAALIRRLEFKGVRYGVTAVSVPKPYARDPEVLELFEELTEDLAFALHKIANEKQLHLLKHIISTLPQPMAFLSSDGRYLAVNDIYGELFSTSPEHIVGSKPADLFGQEFFESHIRPHWGRCLSGETVHYECQVDFPAKGRRWMAMTQLPCRDPAGKVYGIVSHGLDITERKRTEDELRFHSRTLNQIQDRVTVTDLDGNITYMNEAACRMLGKPFEQFNGRHISIFGEDPTLGASQKEILEKTLKHGSWRGEVANVAADGSKVILDCRTQLVHGRSGEPTAICGISTDVTEQKRMEASRRRAEKVRVDLEKRIQQVQKMEAIGSLAGGIAHDFNNLLFPIVGLSEMMLDDLPADSPQRENVLQIFQAAKRGSEMVKQILAFSRQSDHKIVAVQVQTILRDALKLARSSIPANIEIAQRINRDCGSVLADPTQLHQIAMNLITNAYHAVEAVGGGSISVHLEQTALQGKKPGRYVVLRVSDSGCGIDPVHLDKIFEPYFTTKEKGKGTGLGLASVYGIVKDLRGEIKLFSEPGKGTTFEIFLPVADQAAEGAAGHLVQPFETGCERILLVDDDTAVLRLESKMLERLGYRVTPFASSVEALAAFEAGPDEFDMVITDMTMPFMTGDRLARELIEIRPDLPIVICTGFSEKIDPQKAAGMGIKGFLMKPVVKSDLARIVREVLDGDGGKPS